MSVLISNFSKILEKPCTGQINFNIQHFNSFVKNHLQNGLSSFIMLSKVCVVQINSDIYGWERLNFLANSSDTDYDRKTSMVFYPKYHNFFSRLGNPNHKRTFSYHQFSKKTNNKNIFPFYWQNLEILATVCSLFQAYYLLACDFRGQ